MKILPFSDSEPKGKNQDTADKDNANETHGRIFEKAFDRVKIIGLTTVHSAESVRAGTHVTLSDQDNPQNDEEFSKAQKYQNVVDLEGE
jgi:hypothetical protein